jgi:nucleoside-diphosphate-sugar epimerase
MRVLVTGAAGFIGRWVSQLMLSHGHQVIAVDRRATEENPDQSIRRHTIDILDFSRLRQCFADTQPEVVVHLAARTDLAEQRDISGYDANIQGVRNVCEAVRGVASIERVIFTSSLLVCRPGYTPRHDEDYLPHTLYGQSKVETERIVRELDGGGRPWCITRPTTVWGPFMNSHYQRMLALIQRGKFFHCGMLDYFKSYGYVGNVAYQYLCLAAAPLEKINRRVFYVADYEPLSLRRYIDALAIALGRKHVPTLPLGCAKVLSKVGDILNIAGWQSFPFNSQRLHNITTEYLFDLTATREICGDLPYTFQEGIEETVRWYLTCRGGPDEQNIHRRLGVSIKC